MEIKICGIRRAEDISAVNRYLPEYIGFILSPGYRRSVAFEDAARLRAMLDGRIRPVGVFVNAPQSEVRRAVKEIGLFAVQLHGDEDEAYISSLECGCEVWKALRVSGGGDIEDVAGADRLLIDKYDPSAFGGTGRLIERGEVGRVRAKAPLILAGGLDENNVLERIRLFLPDGVDVSSSVETDGFKDGEKIKNFIYKIRNEAQ